MDRTAHHKQTVDACYPTKVLKQLVCRTPGLSRFYAVSQQQSSVKPRSPPHRLSSVAGHVIAAFSKPGNRFAAKTRPDRRRSFRQSQATKHEFRLQQAAGCQIIAKLEVQQWSRVRAAVPLQVRCVALRSPFSIASALPGRRTRAVQSPAKWETACSAPP